MRPRYGRGDVMVYPSTPVDPDFPDASLSFSTTYMEKGDHSATDGKIEVTAHDALRAQRTYDVRKTVPLVQVSDMPQARSAFDQLPRYKDLPVISLLHQRASRLSDLEEVGSKFVRSRAAASSWRKLRLAAASQRKAQRGTVGMLEDERPAVQEPGSRVPTEAEYATLAATWFRGLDST